MGETQSVKGKTVLVTGGTTGIGRAIAIDLAHEGARIFIFGRHEKELKDALVDIRKGDPKADGMTADVAKAGDVEKVFARVDEMFGDLDILIANAGISADGLADLSEDEWRYAVETNLVGYLDCAQEAAKRMRPRKQGHIVLIGSISADTRGEDSSVYVATKAGVQGFAESFAKEMAKEKIRVSLVEPGAVGSDMQGEPEPQRKKIAKHEMLKAEDIAACVRYVLTQPERCNVAAVRIIPRLQD